MITAKNALDALVSAGFATSYQTRRESEYEFRVTEFKVESDRFGISNETYGRQSFLYFWCDSPATASQMIEVLRRAGAKPGTEWNGGPSRGYFDLRVSYFKGRRWWE